MPHPHMLPYAHREEAKRRRYEVGSSGGTVTDAWSDGDSSPPPLPHEAVEEEVFDDMVRDLYVHQGRDNSMEQDDLFTAASTPLFEGCTFSVLRASLELLNLQTIYGWSNASLNALLK